MTSKLILMAIVVIFALILALIIAIALAKHYCNSAKNARIERDEQKMRYDILKSKSDALAKEMEDANKIKAELQGSDGAGNFDASTNVIASLRKRKTSKKPRAQD